MQRFRVMMILTMKVSSLFLLLLISTYTVIKTKITRKKCRTCLSQAPNDTNNKMCALYFIFIVSSIMFSNQMVKVSEPNALFELGSSRHSSRAIRSSNPRGSDKCHYNPPTLENPQQTKRG